MEKLSEETFVNPVTYNRMAHIKEMILAHLREQIIARCVELKVEPLWETEHVETEEDTSRKKCEDCLRVTMSVELNEGGRVVSMTKNKKPRREA